MNTETLKECIDIIKEEVEPLPIKEQLDTMIGIATSLLGTVSAAHPNDLHMQGLLFSASSQAILLGGSVEMQETSMD